VPEGAYLDRLCCVMAADTPETGLKCVFDLTRFANRMNPRTGRAVQQEISKRLLKGKARMSDKGKEGGVAAASVDPEWEQDGEIARYREILAREPSSVLFAPLSEAYRKRGMLSRAIDVCIRGLAHHPNLLSGRVALARALYDAGDIVKARQEAETVIKSAPENLAALRLLASICRDQGDREGLRRTLGAIVCLDPSDQEARDELQGIGPDGEPSAAGPSGAGFAGCGREIVTRTLAEIYATQGYYERAIEIFRKLRILEPGDESLRRRIEELRLKAAARLSRGKPRNEGRN